MSDDEDSFEADIVGVEEFASYGPVLGCAIVPACGIALLISWLINHFGAPAWTNYLLGMAYMSIPYAAFTWWTWNKKAIRLRNGHVLQTDDARRFALALWFTIAAILVFRFVTS